MTITPVWKRVAGIILCLLVATALVWWGRPLYRNWKQKRFVAKAESSLAAKDWRNAGINAQQALSLNPSNLAAARVMAKISTATHQPAAIGWWQRVVSLQPENVSNRLELARASLTVGRTAEANNALQTISESAQHTADYQQLAAILALSSNNFSAAEKHFAEAAQLEPTNQLHDFNRMALRLRSKDRAIAAQAAQSLEQFSTQPALRHDALRNLALDAFDKKDFPRALTLAEQLNTTTNVLFSDRLLQLDFLKQSTNAALEKFIAQAEGLTGTNAENICALSSWLLGAHRAGDAVRWLQTIPEKLRTNPPVAIAVGDALAAKKDWPILQSTLQSQTWTGLEFFRHAQLTQAARELNTPIAAQAEWSAALKGTSDRLPALLALVQFAAGHGWTNEHQQTLLRIVERHPDERRAFEELNALYYASGNSHALLKLYADVRKRDPGNLALKNNFVALSLLLNGSASRAHDLARDIYLVAPTNAIVASTYAFALHLQNKTEEGLAVLEKFSASTLENPSVALYYGVLLAASQQDEKAQKYLALAETAPLLPEERELIRAAKSRNEPKR